MLSYVKCWIVENTTTSYHLFLHKFWPLRTKLRPMTAIYWHSIRNMPNVHIFSLRLCVTERAFAERMLLETWEWMNKKWDPEQKIPFKRMPLNPMWIGVRDSGYYQSKWERKSFWIIKCKNIIVPRLWQCNVFSIYSHVLHAVTC